MWTWGDGGDGQLGHGDDADQLRPKKIECAALSGKRAVSVSTGGIHTMIICDTDELFACGSNFCGQLGLGDTSNQLAPVQVTHALEGKRVVDVAAGGWHTLVLTDDGRCYSTGAGDDGQLGRGDQKRRCGLALLGGALAGQKVVRIAAGRSHSLVQVEGGAVYSFGRGGHGRLGHGDGARRRVPTLIEALEQHEVVEIAAGTITSLVRTAAGDVLQFGLSVTTGTGEENLLPTVIQHALDD